jgi:D-alanyl-D-alanine carboxypeptidase (penicillin-binding protein 5/6)
MRFITFFIALLASVAVHAQLLPPTPAVAARAWLLLDHGTGQELMSQNPDERVEPASLTKLMTAYLSFAAVKQGTLALEQSLPVSEKAWKAQGSKMFIAPDKPVIVDDLLKGMIVQSGNDACIALAEAIAGSEQSFVQAMNHQAQQLGLRNTQFRNATGLPDPQHYSTARDLAMLARSLIRDFPEFYAKYYSMKEFRYNNITQPNRNRLLWLDPAVDGVKTGHTETAGYCLIASAKRGPRRLISVVLGTASDAVRAQESLKLLNFGFQYFDAVKLYDKNQALSQLRVFKGSENTVKVGFADDFVLSLPKGAAARLKVQLVSQQPLLAPIGLGQPVATLKVFIDDKPWGEYSVTALQEVPLAGFFGRLWDAIRLWLE